MAKSRKSRSVKAPGVRSVVRTTGFRPVPRKLPKVSPKILRRLERLGAHKSAHLLSLEPPARQVLQLKLRRKALSVSSHVPRPKSPVVAAVRKVRTSLRMLNPSQVLFCLKRKIRRQVLFALGVGGGRGTAPGRRGKYRRNAESSYGC